MKTEEPDAAMVAHAVRARTVLAGARHGLITLPCARVRGWAGLIDDGGEPVLLVGAGSPPTRVAGRPGARRCSVDVPGAAGERLVLTGRVRVLPGSAEEVARRVAGQDLTILAESGDAELAALGLAVDEVLLCLPTPDAPGARRGAPHRPGEEPRWPVAATGLKVDLNAYALAEPDLITAYAHDLLEHLNAAHADQLRRLARHPGAIPVGVPSGPRPTTTEENAVIGVGASALDRTGLTLWRVTAEGADELRIRFRTPLAEPRSLGLELRRLLSSDPV